VANVSFGDLIGPADDGGATGSGHAKVVGLPQPADDGDVVLQQEVLRKVGHALLGDHLDGGKRMTWAKLQIGTEILQTSQQRMSHKWGQINLVLFKAQLKCVNFLHKQIKCEIEVLMKILKVWAIL